MSKRQKHIRKSWINVRTGVKAVFTDAFLVLQCLVILALYAFAAYFVPVFFYISLALTAICGVIVIVRERDKQIIISWLTLFLFSFGSGFLIYLLADKRICYGLLRRRYKRYTPEYAVNNAYYGTVGRYFADAREFFGDVLKTLETAQRFVFLEFFIVADGELFERFFSILSKKTREGVQVYMILDDAGCQGFLSEKTKKRMICAGIKLKMFSKLLAPFSFKLNFRDHRKIAVIDGKTGYTCGCNIFDDCININENAGTWKDAGLRLDGAAVDGLSLSFLKNWELLTRDNLEYSKYLNKFESFDNSAEYVSYAGGPEIEQAVCREVYKNIILCANERLYIMTPYFIPDGEMYSLIKAKAQAGVDVRLVLPAVPDYPFMYRVTKSNAEKLIIFGVKVYYVPETFLHSKVMLSENCASVGSANFDYRTFYEELDNGVYTDDKSVLFEVSADFESVFAQVLPAVYKKPNAVDTAINAILKLVSPLM